LAAVRTVGEAVGCKNGMPIIISKAESSAVVIQPTAA